MEKVKTTHKSRMEDRRSRMERWTIEDRDSLSSILYPRKILPVLDDG